MNPPSAATPEPPDVASAFARFRAIVCGATLAMVGVSWPLWADRGGFPKVPFLPGLPDPPPWTILAGLAVPLVLAMLGRAWRPMLGVAVAVLAYAVARDQDRLQPWAYQFALFGLAMGMASEARALALARLAVASLYFFSGLSKLDASFVRELGPTFLDAALMPLKIASEAWPAPARTLAILAMPAWEIAVAVGLMSEKWPRLALAGAIGQHLALVGLLGPWALGHSLNVLIWNAAMIAEDVVLFGRPIRPGPMRREPWAGWVAALVIGLAALLPLGEPFGWFDSWPSHALYASHCERAEVLIHEDDAGRFPEPVRSRLGPPDVEGWRRLDLTGWSRDVRGTPLYPQARVGLGIAEALAEAPGTVRPIRVIEWGRARRWDARRDRVERVGLRAIRRGADRYRINAHPAPAAG